MTQFCSIPEFIARVHASLRADDLDAALHLIRELVQKVIAEPLNTAGLLGSEILDNFCQEIGAVNLRRIGHDDRSTAASKPPPELAKRTVVFIASRLYSSGGHTLALADILRLAPPARNVILVTGVTGPTDRSAVNCRFAFDRNVSIAYAPRNSYVEKLTWLQKKLTELAPSEVWLFNHHQDSVAVAAVQPGAGYHLRFYHHGDHHLCLGVCLGYGDHIDIHSMGFHTCRHNVQNRTNLYLPLVVKDHGSRPAGRAARSTSGLTTCTAANLNKIEVPYWADYTEVVPSLLLASHGSHIHIGKLSRFALLKIRARMRYLGLPASKFRYISFVPSLWQALQQNQVDLYIGSFPYGGARTLIEVMGAAIPVALHMHHRSRLLSTYDMTYSGAFFWRDPDDLYEYIRSVNRDELERQAGAARKYYKDHHSEDLLTGALAHPNHPVEAPPPRSGFSPDNLQSALDNATQFGFSAQRWRYWGRFISLVNSLRS